MGRQASAPAHQLGARGGEQARAPCRRGGVRERGMSLRVSGESGREGERGTRERVREGERVTPFTAAACAQLVAARLSAASRRCPTGLLALRQGFHLCAAGSQSATRDAACKAVTGELLEAHRGCSGVRCRRGAGSQMPYDRTRFRERAHAQLSTQHTCVLRMCAHSKRGLSNGNRDVTASFDRAIASRHRAIASSSPMSSDMPSDRLISATNTAQSRRMFSVSPWLLIRSIGASPPPSIRALRTDGWS